jgi:hypothetical protein
MRIEAEGRIDLVPKYHAMKTYRGVEVKLHTF